MKPQTCHLEASIAASLALIASKVPFPPENFKSLIPFQPIDVDSLSSVENGLMQTPWAIELRKAMERLHIETDQNIRNQCEEVIRLRVLVEGSSVFENVVFLLALLREARPTSQMAGILLKKCLKLFPGFPEPKSLALISQATQNAFFWVQDGSRAIFSEFAAEFLVSTLDLTESSGISFLAFVNNQMAQILSKSQLNDHEIRFMTNSISFYLSLFQRFESYGLRLPALLSSFSQTFQPQIENIFVFIVFLSSQALILDNMTFYLLSPDIITVFYKALHLGCKLLKSEALLSVSLRVYLEIFQRWSFVLKGLGFEEAVQLEGKSKIDFFQGMEGGFMSSETHDQSARQFRIGWLLHASEVLSSLLSLFEPAFQLSVGQELILTHLFPILQVQFVSHFKILAPTSLAHPSLFKVTFDCLNLFVTLTDDLLNKDYLLCIQDQSKIEEYSFRLKSVLDARLPFFEQLFIEVCEVFLHSFVRRLLVGMSGHRDMAERLYRVYENHFGIRIELRRDIARDIGNIEGAQTCQNWLFDDKGDKISELESYFTSGFESSENSCVEAGMKFLRLLSEYYGEKPEFEEFAEKINEAMKADLKRILIQSGINPLEEIKERGGLFKSDFLAGDGSLENKNASVLNPRLTHFDSATSQLRLSLLYFLIFGESHIFELIRNSDFEETAQLISRLPVSLLDLTHLRFGLAYIENCYGNPNLKFWAGRWGWRLFQSDRLLVSYFGLKILLTLLYKIPGKRLREMHIAFGAIFERLKSLFLQVVAQELGNLSYFLELFGEFVKVIPPSAAAMEAGLEFLEQLNQYTDNLNPSQKLELSGSNIMVHSCQIMVDLFNRAIFDASEECFKLAQRFSVYLTRVVEHFERSQDFFVLDNCFYQMLLCFLFKMEKWIDSLFVEASANPSFRAMAKSRAQGLYNSLKGLFFSKLSFLFDPSLSSKNLLTFFLSINLVAKLDALGKLVEGGVEVVFSDEEASHGKFVQNDEIGDLLPMHEPTETASFPPLIVTPMIPESRSSSFFKPTRSYHHRILVPFTPIFYESPVSVVFQHLRQFSEYLLSIQDFHHFLLSFDLYEMFLIFFPSYASEVASAVSHFLELNLLSKTELQEDLQSNLCLCLIRLLSRLILLEPKNVKIENPIEKYRLVERLLQVFQQIKTRGSYQEYFSLGIVVEHMLSKSANFKNTNDHTLQSLTSLFQSINLTNNSPTQLQMKPLNPPNLLNQQSKPDPLRAQIKTHCLLTLLSQVLDQMNSQFARSEGLILQNLRCLVIDSPDCLFLVEKLFDPAESQVGALMKEHLLAEVFDLRGRLSATLNDLAGIGLVAKDHAVFGLI